jgi:hypothetical protein
VAKTWKAIVALWFFAALCFGSVWLMDRKKGPDIKTDSVTVDSETAPEARSRKDFAARLSGQFVPGSATTTGVGGEILVIRSNKCNSASFSTIEAGSMLEDLKLHGFSGVVCETLAGERVATRSLGN